MCEMCEKSGINDPDRNYQPLRLRCKTVELAAALRVIVIEMNGGMKVEDGSVMQPYTDGDVLVMPWAGHPKFVNAITELATTTRAAVAAEVREMTYGAMAQGMATDVENVRDFGEKISTAMTEFMSTVGSKRPVNIDSLMSTLDDDLDALQANEHEEKKKED
jgi:hypothetical protein